MADAYWGNVVLLVHFDGTNGSTSASDVSYRAHTVTSRNGAALTTTAGDFKFGTAGLSVGGSGAAFDTPSSADFQFGTGDFTVEGWLKTSDTSGGFIDYYTSAHNGWQAFIEGGQVAWYFGDTRILLGATTVSNGAFHHIALSRTGTTLKLFVDGVLDASATDTSNYNFATNQLSIGRQFVSSPGAAVDLVAKIDDVRITKGIGRYTAGFSAPSAAFDDTPVGAVTSLGLVANFGTPRAVTLTGQASGFNPTAFGAPRLAQVAAGWFATTFGTPLAIYTQFGDATGFNPTNFGSPRLVTVDGAASGFNPTAFGTAAAVHRQSASGFLATTFSTPKAQQRQPASGFFASTFGTPHVISYHRATTIGRTSTFGTPTTPTNRSARASGLNAAPRFGTPTAFPYTVGTLDRNVRPVQFRPTHFGDAAAAATATGGATGLYQVTFGTPTADQNRRAIATGFAAAVSFGTPTAAQRGATASIRAVHFGTASSARRMQASGTAPVTRFGTPTYTRSGARQAHGWPCARFGTPRIKRGTAARATGFLCLHMGTPASSIGGHARSIAPQTFFGTPQAERNPRC